jgi:hypothetical protein
MDDVLVIKYYMVDTMDKVNKQIEQNVAIIVFSCLVIYIVKSVALGRMAYLHECAGADIVFTMITSLATTISWRVVEKVEGNFVFFHNIVVFVVLALFAILYGIAIATNGNEVIVEFIYIAAGAFLVIYIIENVIIVNHFKKKQTVTVEYFGYRDREN